MPTEEIPLPGKTDALPDPADFRDVLFQPTLVEVPTARPLAVYRQKVREGVSPVPVLDQQKEGACTGFALATVAHYLLRCREHVPDEEDVSPRMFYEVARRYDEWPGEDYSGSSARGAMKGWHKHGICSHQVAPYVPGETGWVLDNQRARDAVRRPLGAYYRVNHRDLIAMHAAISEVGILYATSRVHSKWGSPGPDGVIETGGTLLGGHAFAIVGYTENGLWIQNSWGTDWGLDGFGLVSYDDWLAHGLDVWVARLGAPVILKSAVAAATALSAAAAKSRAYGFSDVRPHVVSVGNDGRLRGGGTHGTVEADLDRIFGEDLPETIAGWQTPRLLLYAHGGLVDEKGAIQRVADYRPALLEREIYPLAFVWKTDFWTTIKNILDDLSRRRRPEGFLDSAKDFLLDRLDDALEPLARVAGGKALWDEMKENGERATANDDGAGRKVLDRLAGLYRGDEDGAEGPELHLAAHSAGAVFLAPLVRLLTAEGKIESGYLERKRGYGLRIASLTLWAPACTVELFEQAYLPAIESGAIGRFTLFTLTEEAERDDHCARIYNKSLLYLVSHALEARPRIPLVQKGTPLLGLARDVAEHEGLQKLFASPRGHWIQAPNDLPEGSPSASRAKSHGAFDDEKVTLRSTLARIVGSSQAKAQFDFHAGAQNLAAQRQTRV